MNKIENVATNEISDDAVRGGVTGHYVRYVLVFGLAGVILSFAAIAIYFGFDQIKESIAQAWARGPIAIVQDLAPYALIVALGAVVAAVLFRLWNMLSEPDQNATQTGMRMRVVAQFAVICVIAAIAYLSGV